MRTALFILANAIAYFSAACCGRMHSDIRYEIITGSTYRIDVIVYTCLSLPFDLPEIEVSFDQQDAITVPRTSITDNPSEDIRRSEYTFQHDIVGTGMHTVDAIFMGRGGGVVNIPNSISELACIRAEILVDPAITSNSSILFDTPPTSVTQNWNTLTHIPSPIDADGDSLSFEWIVPRGSSCLPINGYTFPSGPNFAGMNAENGTFTWDYPTYLGETNLTIRGSEYRDGQLIGRVTRDMIICVFELVIGTDEMGSIQQLALSPSITHDLVRIENPTLSPLSVLIHDTRGAVVHSTVINTGPTTIDLNPLPSGAYFVSATANSGLRFTGRVLKQ